MEDSDKLVNFTVKPHCVPDRQARQRHTERKNKAKQRATISLTAVDRKRKSRLVLTAVSVVTTHPSCIDSFTNVTLRRSPS